MFGDTAYQYALSDTNIILVLFIHAYVHLQHSHMWISFRGVLGDLRFAGASPGAPLQQSEALQQEFRQLPGAWDWMFGTLYIPAKEREPLVFGFADHPDAHTVKGELVDPLINAASHLKPLLPRRRRELAPVTRPQAGVNLLGPDARRFRRRVNRPQPAPLPKTQSVNLKYCTVFGLPRQHARHTALHNLRSGYARLC